MSSYCHSMPEPHPIIVLVIQDAGFGGITKLRHLKVDHGLVTTLVERWRPETNTFHLSTRECTITLQIVYTHFISFLTFTYFFYFKYSINMKK